MQDEKMQAEMSLCSIFSGAPGVTVGRTVDPGVICPVPCPLAALPTMCGNLGEVLLPLGEVGTLLYGAFHIVRTWLWQHQSEQTEVAWMRTHSEMKQRSKLQFVYSLSTANDEWRNLSAWRIRRSAARNLQTLLLLLLSFLFLLLCFLLLLLLLFLPRGRETELRFP